MNRQVADLGLDHNQLEEIAGPVRAHHQVARRILPELDPRDGLSVGMVDVFVGDAMPAGGAVNVHTQ